MKKLLGTSFIIITLFSSLLFSSCDNGSLDLDLGFDFKGKWKLYQTCLSSGCLDTDPDIEVTIEFKDDELVEKQDGQVIGGGEFVIAEAQSGANETT